MSFVMASHQPHFFPWLGYLDKMAKADLFAINDIVQPVAKSGIVRNKILTASGEEQYIGVNVVKKGLTDIAIKDLLISDMTATRNAVLGRIKSAYRLTPFFKDIYPRIEKILSPEYEKVLDLDMATVNLLRELFEISTPLIFHSEMNLSGLGDNKSENIIKKCLSQNADIYLSGVGARKYIEPEKFAENKVTLIFQDFEYPTYPQKNSVSFVPNLSSIDILFNCGVSEAKRIFWQNVNKNNKTKI